jgi:LysM repeat protein
VIEETSTTLGGDTIVCPFVAFEDDRDHRSTAPDYRHRCFAAAEPEPRAFPHQERYCLAPDFAQCPVFLEWARQEAAGVGHVGTASLTGAAAEDRSAVASGGEADDGGPAFLARRTRPEPVGVPAGSRRSGEGSANLWSYEGEVSRSPAPTAPPAPSSLVVPAVAMARRGPTHPGWENPPRVENYPRLRARDDRRANQPLLAAAVAVAIVMVALILIPILLSSHGSGGIAPQASASSPAQGSAIPGASDGTSVASTPTASATFLRYAVKPNDNLSTIAQRFNLHLWEIEVANPDITDFNYLQVGQILNIPPPGLLTQPPSTPSPGAS